MNIGNTFVRFFRMGINDNYYKIMKRIKWLRRKKNKTIDEMLELLELQQMIDVDKKGKNKKNK